MALLIEIVFFGVLPLAFALWQIIDVRREQQRRQRDRERSDHDAD
jgi:hypothetical protein